MYSESDRHCSKCICVYCDCFQTEYCLEGKNYCEHCDNTAHVDACPFHQDRQ